MKSHLPWGHFLGGIYTALQSLHIYPNLEAPLYLLASCRAQLPATLERSRTGVYQPLQPSMVCFHEQHSVTCYHFNLRLTENQAKIQRRCKTCACLSSATRTITVIVFTGSTDWGAVPDLTRVINALHLTFISAVGNCNPHAHWLLNKQNYF